MTQHETSAEAAVAAGQPDRIASHPTAVRYLGKGGRAAVALHCSLAHGGAWAPLAQAVPGLSFVAPDLPGHGDSAPPGAGDLHALSTRIAAELMRQTGHGAPVDLLGHSFGGTVALRVALEHPELVRSLTLIEPVLFVAAGDTPAGQRQAAMQAKVEALLAEDPEAAAAMFHAVWGDGIPFEALAARQRQSLASRMYLVAALSPVLQVDSAGLLRPGRLEELRVPVLLAGGSRSPEVVGLIHDRLAARLPDIRRIVVEGAAHMLPMTHPGPLGQAVTALLAES